MPSPEEIARSFSSHRFEEAFPHIEESVEWILIGAESILGKDAVVEACRATLAALAETTTEFPKFRTIAGDDGVAVDSVGEYTDADGGRSVVASCDLYDFADGRIVRITSYTVELPE